MQELLQQIRHPLTETLVDGSEARLKRLEGHYCLGHGPMTAGRAEVDEITPDEIAGIASVAEVAHRHHERSVHDSRHQGPAHVLELEEEICHVRNRIVAWHVAEEHGKDLIDHAAVLRGLGDELEALHRDFR